MKNSNSHSEFLLLCVLCCCRPVLITNAAVVHDCAVWLPPLMQTLLPSWNLSSSTSMLAAAIRAFASASAPIALDPLEWRKTPPLPPSSATSSASTTLLGRLRPWPRLTSATKLLCDFGCEGRVAALGGDVCGRLGQQTHAHTYAHMHTHSYTHA